MLPYWEKYFTVSWIYFLRFQYDMLPFWEIFSRFLNMFLTFSIWCVALLRNLFPFLEYLLGVCVILFSSLPILMNIVSKYNARGINYCFLNIGCSCDPVQQPSYRKRIILSSPGDNIHYTSIVNIFVNILKMYKYAACSFCYISFWEGNNKLKSILEVKGQN